MFLLLTINGSLPTENPQPVRHRLSQKWLAFNWFSVLDSLESSKVLDEKNNDFMISFSSLRHRVSCISSWLQTYYVTKEDLELLFSIHLKCLNYKPDLSSFKVQTQSFLYSREAFHPSELRPSDHFHSTLKRQNTIINFE